jgi:hypothetical protein
MCKWDGSWHEVSQIVVMIFTKENGWHDVIQVVGMMLAGGMGWHEVARVFRYLRCYEKLTCI